MPAVLLTDLSIKNLKAKPKQYDVCDIKARGLALRVSPGGAKTYVFLYKFNRRSRRMNLGRSDALSLADARKKTQNALAALANGQDPQFERRQAMSPLFDDAAAEFLEHPSIRSIASWSERNRIIKKEFVRRWNGQPLSAITRKMVSDATSQICDKSGPSAGRHAHAAIRRMFNWCVEHGHLEQSPCWKLNPPAKASKRRRVLTSEELRCVWNAADQFGNPFGQFVKLVMITAQRRSEVANLRRQDISFEDKSWCQAHNKSDRPHIVPLSALAIATLSDVPPTSELLFPARGRNVPMSGFSKWKKRLDELSGVRDWTLHDLRRTAATSMAKLKHAPHVVDLVLNHSSRDLSGVSEVYNLYKYLDEKRSALDDWSKELAQIIGLKEPVNLLT